MTAKTPEPLPSAARGAPLSVEVALRGGQRVRVRPVLASDRAAVVEFLHHLSRESLELRFFSAVTVEVVTAEILSGTARPDRLSLIAETSGEVPSRIVGHAEYVRSTTDPTRAEVAFLVADDHQGLGVGTLLLRQLARHARSVGVRTFDALVLSENRAMLDMFSGAGFPNTTAWNAQEASVVLDISHEVSTALVPVTPPGAAAVALA
jgi:acetate---CoA ligase (ADP-forming)